MNGELQPRRPVEPESDDDEENEGHQNEGKWQEAEAQEEDGQEREGGAGTYHSDRGLQGPRNHTVARFV